MNKTPLMRYVDSLVIHEYGSSRKAAKALGIDHTYLCRLASGFKNNPSDEVLRRLGLEKVITYKRVSKP